MSIAITKVKQYFQLSKVSINNFYINFYFTKNAKITKLFAKKNNFSDNVEECFR